MPPRRTGTTTAARPLAARCLAFQLSGATTMYSFRPTVPTATPLTRGSPDGVTWATYAKDAFVTARHTSSLVM